MGEFKSKADIASALIQDVEVFAHWEPVIYKGPFLPASVLPLADGITTTTSTVPAPHIREGIVIRPVEEREARNLGRVQLKVVSNAFLEKDNK